MLRVLHTVGTYLNLSENWIYPQITCVANVEGGAFSDSTANLEMFPLAPGRLTVSPPPWELMLGFPRVLDALARRIGRRDVLAMLKIRAWRPHVVHAHFGVRGWDSLGLKAALKIPMVTSFYGYDAWMLPKREPIWRQRYEQLFTAGEAFLVEGPAMRDRLVDLGCPHEKIWIQRIGVDLEKIPFVPKVVSSPLRILMVGRFVEKKGFLDGLRACAIARSRGVKLRVTVVGDATSGDPSGVEIRKQLEALAVGNDLRDTVRFRGFLSPSDTRTCLEEHNVFLCPSKQARDGDAEGGSPVVLTEAMGRGLLCIGTNHCDIPEVILKGQTGYLCEEGDVTALADLITAISKGSLGWDHVITTARMHIEKNFSLSRQLDNLCALYRSVFDNWRHVRHPTLSTASGRPT